jgi:hypothetical protein
MLQGCREACGGCRLQLQNTEGPLAGTSALLAGKFGTILAPKYLNSFYGKIMNNFGAKNVSTLLAGKLLTIFVPKYPNTFDGKIINNFGAKISQHFLQENY